MSKIEKTNLEYEEEYTDMIDRLTEQLKTILPIFLEEFKDYIDPRRLEYLSDKKMFQILFSLLMMVWVHGSMMGIFIFQR